MNDIEISETLILTLPERGFVTAHELAESHGISSQKASHILCKLEKQHRIASRRIKAGRGEVKCYYLPLEYRDGGWTPIDEKCTVIGIEDDIDTYWHPEIED